MSVLSHWQNMSGTHSFERNQVSKVPPIQYFEEKDPEQGSEERKERKQRLYRILMAPLSLLIKKNKPNYSDWKELRATVGKQHWALASFKSGREPLKGEVWAWCMSHQKMQTFPATSLCKPVFHLTRVTGISKWTSQHEPCRPSGPGSKLSCHWALYL